ncbi:Na(+)-translocating NADH-quinone reductase subunit A [Enhygromyxa salina]|uniref:Na(+)-translocating NADH-quinone reductase subunit A n=1 Tax=Enhygromyxa salina TaxID=215803 RepID=A0A2S9Y0Y9_9BACT|nr:Na(+)-translocating NADH-quinone reductase subunit A [Enhygromyxa salina]PRP98787.1 Na(+)-translocating NADH-quinone reductase subunit A [Enhygromyxa salina]
MAVHTIKKGLDLPITGAPEQKIEAAPAVTRVAVVAADYPGMKPRMHIKVGESVKRGQALFEDRKSEGVMFTAPGAGKVAAINRGEFRALQSVVIELSASEREGKPAADEFQAFESYAEGTAPAKLSRAQVVALLQESGMWTAIRARPFGRVPPPSSAPPRSVFVTAADTNPHAPSVEQVLAGREKDFEAGLAVVAKLTSGKVYVCKGAGTKVPTGKISNVQLEEFHGPHPAGTVGVHIHTLDPVSRDKTVWHVGYQDVILIGRLFATGKLDTERVISVAGPTVRKPKLITTRLGASIDELVDGALEKVENRVISGSVLSGRKSMGEIHGYLGRYHLQISALREGREREFLGWLKPGADMFSTSGAYVSSLTPNKKFDFTTALNGSHRHMVPLGMYERVFPFDILPTFLLRAILVKDVGRAEELGVLELDEEDVALCTFVCPGKQDYGPVLRDNLETIWKEG